MPKIHTSNPENVLCFKASRQAELQTNPRGKSNKDKYEDAQAKLIKYRDEYAVIANKLTAGAKKKEDQIDKTEKLIEQLESIKDQPQISTTAKNSCRSQWSTWRWGRFESISNKYTKKGTRQEEQGITLASMVLGRMFEKNTVRLYDLENHMTGEPDLFVGESILTAEETIDIKCSWSLKTFYESIDAELKKVYDWQGVDYMALTGARRHRVFFCLINTSYDLVLDEIKKATFNEWDGDIPLWAQIQVVVNHVYDRDTLDKYLAGLDIDPRNSGVEALATYKSFIEMPIEERFFEFVIERDEDKIEQARSRNRFFHNYAMEEFQTGKFRKNINLVSEEEEAE